MKFLTTILRLASKELRSLAADRVLMILIIWSFTGAIVAASKGVSQELSNAPVAVVDEDRSPLSGRLIDTLGAPWFSAPMRIELNEMDRLLDQGKVSFVIWIPAHFQRDVVAGRTPSVQVNIDATNMSQSFIGAGYIRQFFSDALAEYLHTPRPAPAIRLATRVRYNPNLTGFWFGGVMELINMVNMLTIILVGAALIREREHGTLEHLLAMPLAPSQIMLAKIGANGLVVLTGSAFALCVMIRGVMQVPIPGSVTLFLAASAIYLFSAGSMGILLALIARSMPQFGLLVFLVIIPIQMLSGGVTPRESMPLIIQWVMLAAPNTWFVRLAQAGLYRGADFYQVWPDMLAIAALGAVFFSVALSRFRHAVALTKL